MAWRESGVKSLLVSSSAKPSVIYQRVALCGDDEKERKCFVAFMYTLSSLLIGGFSFLICLNGVGDSRRLSAAISVWRKMANEINKASYVMANILVSWRDICLRVFSQLYLISWRHYRRRKYKAALQRIRQLMMSQRPFCVYLCVMSGVMYSIQ